MFSDLKSTVEAIIGAVQVYRKVKSTRLRNEAGTDLLEAQIHFDEIQKIGIKLLEIGGSDPAARLCALTEDNRRTELRRIHMLLAKQQRRLHKLNSLIHEHLFLDVFSDGTRSRIKELIGTKEEGLIGVVAAIEFYFIFGPLLRTEDAKTRGEDVAMLQYQGDLILAMHEGMHASTIDVETARTNLTDLRNAVKELRRVITAHFSLEECMLLSQQAKGRSAQVLE